MEPVGAQHRAITAAYCAGQTTLHHAGAGDSLEKFCNCSSGIVNFNPLNK